MSQVIVVDVREGFLSEVAACCRGLDAEVISVVDPADLKNRTAVMSDLVVAVWADMPQQQGIQVPQVILQAIAASRWHIPVVLYGSDRSTLTGLLQPGMICPHVVLSAHACSVAGTIQRVLRQLHNRQQRAMAFEDWACSHQVPLATTPGKVCVYSSNGNGGFASLAAPQDPLRAVGSLLTQAEPVAEPCFY